MLNLKEMKVMPISSAGIRKAFADAICEVTYIFYWRKGELSTYVWGKIPKGECYCAREALRQARDHSRIYEVY